MASNVAKRTGLDLPMFMTGWWRPLERLLAEFEPATAGVGALSIEQYVEKDTLIVRGELPGVDIDKDVEIWIADGLLHIRAERREKKEEGDGKQGYRSEFRYGMIGRSIPLPQGVDESAITATYADGVLEVRVPLPTAEAKAETRRTVPVQRG